MTQTKSDPLYWLTSLRSKWVGNSAFSKIKGESTPSFLCYGEPDKVVRLSPDVFNKRKYWYIIGDIHGDMYALFQEVMFIRKEHLDDKHGFGIIFLGDLIDRGPHPLECLWFLLKFSESYPDQLLWIAGNHDIAFSRNEEENSYTSSVSPAEFLECLNSQQIDSVYKDFGKEYIELAAGLPRAVLLPDGLLLTHGGFPLVDLQSQLEQCKDDAQRQQWLNSPAALQDFTWTRITRYPKKRPNRESKGCSYGYKDFEAFCNATTDFFPVKRLVTAHEHPDGGFDLHPEWKDTPALTLTGFGFHPNYESAEAYNSNYRDHLVIARCRENDLPEIIKIPVDRHDLKAFYDAEIAPRFASAAAPSDALTADATKLQA